MIPLKNEIVNCKACDYGSILQNTYSESNPHFGKLLPNQKSDIVKYFFIGLNPSLRRFPGSTMVTYEGNPFTELLKKIGIYDQSYFTNLVKCSSFDNKVDINHCDICFEQFLKRELETTKPQYVICLGNQVFEYVKTKHDPVYKIKHPSYYYAYKKEPEIIYEREIKILLGFLK
jgi:uracil-DNA glycosylase family 4